MTFHEIKNILIEQGIYFHFAQERIQQSEIDTLPEKNDLSSVSLTRYLEFLTGRWCAHRALEELNPAFNTHIPIGNGGEPVFPSEILGSISHSRNNAGAVTTLKSLYNGIGLDIENTSRIMSDNAFQWLINEDESEWIIKAEYYNKPVFRITLFSIKEAVIKAFYSIAEKKIPFSSVSVRAFRLSENCSQEQPLSVDFHEQSLLERYTVTILPFISDDSVITICTVKLRFSSPEC